MILATVTVLTASACLLAACGGGDASSDVGIEGTWNLVSIDANNEDDSASEDDITALAQDGTTISLTFKEGGEADMTVGGSTAKGTWTQEGDGWSMSIGDSTMELSISGSRLEVSDEGDVLNFQKAS